MPVIQQLKDQMNQVQALKVITSAFSEISALRINSIKETFDQNSLYFEEVSQIYHLVKRVASKQLRNKHLLDTSDNASDKSLHVAITSNHGFYGTLNRDAVDHMAEESTLQNNERAIIGKFGITYARNIQSVSPFQSFVFQKDEPTSEEIQAFLDQTKQYSRIYVYYPKFITMFSQQIDQMDISHSPEWTVSPHGEIHYIFEPELPKILAFFEKQVRYILFVRVLLETSLSRTATRLITMDAAERRAGEIVDSLHTTIVRVRQSFINAQLIASSGQLKKWREDSSI